MLKKYLTNSWKYLLKGKTKYGANENECQITRQLTLKEYLTNFWKYLLKKNRKGCVQEINVKLHGD